MIGRALSGASQIAISPAPPGWYTDPWERAEWRWWDGVAWTPRVASGGTGWWDGPPPRPSVEGSSGASSRTVAERTLPPSGIAIAALGFVVGVVLSGLLGGIVYFGTGASSTSAAVTLAGLAGLWTGLVGACVLASRTIGTGSLGRDIGVGWVWMDAVRGVGASLTGRVVTTLVAIPLIDAGLTSSNTKIISTQHGSPLSLLAIGIAVVIGAPIVEEMFFRGLLLRSLASRLPYGWAVIIQALAFGLAHADPAAGWHTLSLVVITATFGVTQGIFARRWSLGPLMVSHALFNLLPVLLIAFK